MLKFWYYKYELIPNANLGALADENSRKGALLKIQWPNKKIGYADLFPWPELGDKTLDEELANLAKFKMSPLVEQAIWLAKKDAAIRAEGKNAFAGAARIKNHYLISDFTKFKDENMKELRTAGFTTVKIKVGRSIDEEAKFVERIIKQNPIAIRLDFNSKTNFAEYERFMSHLNPGEKAKIEFAEDPMPWHPEAWKDASSLGVPFAIDNEFSKIDWEKIRAPLPFKFVVIKPARQDMDKTVKIIDKFALKMVVTSSMDHPVGVAHACLVASELKKFYPNTLIDCGCLSLRAYKPNDFSTRIQAQGPYLIAIPGTGIGFNDLLDKINWIPVGK